MTITITTILLVFSLILGGTGATVYAAQGSLPEEPLYAIKLLSEDLAVQIPQSAPERLDLILNSAERRVAEMVALAGSGVEPPVALVDRLEFQLDRALRLAAEMEGEQLMLALSQVRTRLENQAFSLADLAPDTALLIRAREAIQIRLNWTEYGLGDPGQFQHQAQERHRFNLLPGGPGGYGPGPNVEEPGGYGPSPYAGSTPTPGSGYGPGPGAAQAPGGNGFGPGPYTTGTPTPGSGYGPGPGPNPSQTPGIGDGNGPGPYTTGTPTPGSGYGPGPGPDPTCSCPNPGPADDNGSAPDSPGGRSSGAGENDD